MSITPLSTRMVCHQAPPPAYPRPMPGGLAFLQGDPVQGNRQALWLRTHEGALQALVDAREDLRSRVHEYGGRPYTLGDNALYYCRHGDSGLYRRSLHPGGLGEAQRLNPGDEEPCRYGDLYYDVCHRRLLAICEKHAGEAGGRVSNSLVALHGEGPEALRQVLFDQSDFVTSARVSGDGRWLVCQAWDHPNMPWDDTSLWISNLDPQGFPLQWRRLAGPGCSGPAGQGGALMQPRFGPDGSLYFLADWSGWWNLYRFTVQALAEGGEPEAICAMSAECGGPQWQFGGRHYDFYGDETLYLALTRAGFWELARVDLHSRTYQVLQQGLGHLDQLWVEADSLYCLAGGPAQPLSLQRLDLKAPQASLSPLYSAQLPDFIQPSSLSRPIHLSYRHGGGQAHGLFYPPAGQAATARPATEALPPLLVMVHGGPTSAAKALFNPLLQFWTSRGFAVFDVNHRGSSGYGREFRHSLYGRWGEADVEDVIAAVEFLGAEGQVDTSRVVIRGGSAGGYLVLAALSRSRRFAAGCSYYGISDLSLLARDTHKFESRYLDQLIGPYPEAEALYRARSPLYRIQEISAPVLLLQGLQDRVVPPNQAEAIYRRLKARQPQTRYLSFADEGHGFRKPENMAQALEAEWAFYRSVLPGLGGED